LIDSEINGAAMTLDKTIGRLLEEHPTVFGRRDQALSYLYLSQGNNYKWINGKLIYQGQKGIEENVRDFEWRLNRLMAKSPSFKSMNEDAIQKAKNDPTDWYVISRFSRIIDIPSNVNGDYLAGAEEIIDLMESEYKSFTPEKIDKNKLSPSFLDRLSTLQDNMRYVPSIRKKINSLKRKS